MKMIDWSLSPHASCVWTWAVWHIIIVLGFSVINVIYIASLAIQYQGCYPINILLEPMFSINKSIGRCTSNLLKVGQLSKGVQLSQCLTILSNFGSWLIIWRKFWGTPKCLFRVVGRLAKRKPPHGSDSHQFSAHVEISMYSALLHRNNRMENRRCDQVCI